MTGLVKSQNPMKKIIVTMSDEKNEIINNITVNNGDITIFGKTYNFIGYSNGQKLYERNGRTYTQWAIEEMVEESVKTTYKT